MSDNACHPFLISAEPETAVEALGLVYLQLFCYPGRRVYINSFFLQTTVFSRLFYFMSPCSSFDSELFLIVMQFCLRAWPALFHVLHIFYHTRSIFTWLPAMEICPLNFSYYFWTWIFLNHCILPKKKKKKLLLVSSKDICGFSMTPIRAW